MAKREKAIWVLLVTVFAAALMIPAKSLFADGVYSWHIRQPEFLNMALEMTGLALGLGAVWFFVGGFRLKLLLTAVVCMVFSWCHVVFLPMVVSGAYVLYLYLAGHAIRRWGFRIRVSGRDGWIWDFLLGCCAVITLFCLMSAVGIGSIPVLRAAAAVTGAGAFICHIPAGLRLAKSMAGGGDSHLARSRKDNPIVLTKIQSLLLVFIIGMVLIQVGRMNISLDFDSLWYGLRSQYILDNGRGIYENMGSVGLVYTYSKGLEVLLLPLSDLASYSYLLFFNVWMSVLSLVEGYRIGRFYMNRTCALLAAACLSSIPAIMNMGITAKTDSMTLMVQLAMVLSFLHYQKTRQWKDLIAGFGALLLSWTLKPTALVFSSAVFGMSVLYLLVTRQFPKKAARRLWLGTLFPAAALTGIWARTVMIVGVPVTSVFSSIFLKLGFSMNYPFCSQPLNGSGETGGNIWLRLADTIYRMCLDPSGDDMSHVVIAWGTSLVLFLAFAAVLAAALKAGGAGVRGKSGGMEDQNLCRYAHTVMLPFLLVCLISLLMLGQIDGNYFMLLDVGLVLYGCVCISRIGNVVLKRSILIMMIPMLLFNVPVTMVSNWAWSLGFTPAALVNKGYMDHKSLRRQEMNEGGNAAIWDILAADQRNRVIAVGSHPQVFDFPCNVQSYDDITSTWGNVRLVKTMDDFIGYLTYAKTDYIYMQGGYMEEDSRCYQLMGYLIEAGILTDIVYEDGNVLARVDLSGTYGPGETAAYQRYLKEYPVRCEK